MQVPSKRNDNKARGRQLKDRSCYVGFLRTGDRRQARHFYLAKQFCFLDADCLVVGGSQGSSRRSAGKSPVKPPRPEGDSETIRVHTDAGTIDSFFNNRYIYWRRQWDLHGRGT